MNYINTQVECRICLGILNDDDIVHVETKVINQKNVLQAIEEVADIKVLENDGLPEHVCKNCFKSLESSINFRKMIISSHIELQRSISLKINSLNNLSDPLLSSNENQKERDGKVNESVKEDNEGRALLEKKKDISFKDQEKSDSITGYSTKVSEEDSDSDWNGLKDDFSSSDDAFCEEPSKISPLRKLKASIKRDKTDLNEDKNFFNKKLQAGKRKNETDFSYKNNDFINDKSKRKSLNSPNSKLSAVLENEWTDDNFSDISFTENERNRSLKPANKKIIETRIIRKKRRIIKKPIKDITDTSSDSDSNPDIPLEELRKEIKDLENKAEPKVRKKKEKRENADGPRLCPICGKLFKARQSFNSHMTTVHRKKPDKPEKISCLCPDCGRVITGTRQNFVAHRRYHHSDEAQVKKRFTCDVCPRKFYREKNLIIHQRIHKGEKGYVSKLCPDKSYTEAEDKEDDSVDLEGEANKLTKKSRTSKNSRLKNAGDHHLYKCKQCTYQTTYEGRLTRHLRGHNTLYQCEKCDYKTRRGYDLKRHVLQHKDPKEVFIYNCTECDFQADQRLKLTRHSIIHKNRDEVDKHVCPECGFQTIHRNVLTRHVLIHKSPQDVVMFKCSECSYKSARSDDLKKHCLQHKDLKNPLFCSQCDFQTNKKHKLAQHSINHTHPGKADRHVCSDCGYKALNKGTLYWHRLSHRTSELFRCDQCPFQSIHKRSLKDHILIHKKPDEVDMHKCEQCSYQTFRKGDLKKHLLIHNKPGEAYLYKCEKCEYQTANKHYFRNHFQRHESAQL